MSSFKRIGKEGLLEVMNSVERAWRAQEKYKKENPEIYESWKKKEDERAENEKIERFTRKSVPRRVAKDIIRMKEKGILRYELFHRIKEAFDGKKNLILLVGHIGAGKTIASCIWLPSQFMGKYIESEYLFSLNQHYDKNKIKMLQGLEGIVIDEININDERERKKIEFFLRKRYNDERLKTIAIVDAPPKDAHDIWGSKLGKGMKDDGELIVSTDIYF